MYVLGHIPKVADSFETVGYRFEVMDMDKNRVDKVLVSHVMPASQDAMRSGQGSTPERPHRPLAT
jgi:putative hemolysin